MKTKKLERKLSLSKETISNLGDDMMNAIHGGATIEKTVCITQCITNCAVCPTNRTICSVCCP
jgi:hypothetical protein